MLSLFIRIYLKYLSDAVIVVPLLQELLFVRCWVALDKILQLREI
jgi:hypothetical protein